MLELTIQRSGKKLFSQKIDEKPIVIGRSKENSIKLFDSTISRKHCRIEWKDGTLILRNLSINGTFVNGKKVNDVEVGIGDRIAIGDFTFMIASTSDIVPIKTVVERSKATNILAYEPTEKILTSEKLQFTITSPDQPITKKTVSSKSITIGQHASCDLPVADKFISRRHCRIVSDGKSLRLIDLASTNGTFVEDIKITKVIIPPQGVFRVGKSTISYKRLTATEKIKPGKEDRLGSMIGTSRAMREVFTLIKRAAQSDATVAIIGETGTGKELCAHEIHASSLRKKGPFVAINCGAVPPDIIESQLFGHERGAFTGALERSIGLFEQANGGTIFLDEIGEMPLDLQTRLLRVIESNTIRRLGGRDEIEIDARIICATNRNLRRMVEDGRFRDDLFYRIYILPIDLPALRDRMEELPVLTEHILKEIAGKDRNVVLTDGALKKLARHDWPGNVRELKNTLMRAIVSNPGDIMDERNIDPVPLKTTSCDGKEFQDNERSFLESSLVDNNYNISKTAKKLSLARTTLQNKIKKYGINLPR